MTQEPRPSRELPLVSGAVAIIDSEDYDLVSQSRWTTLKRPRARTLYVKCTAGPHDEQYLHRVVLNAPRGMHVDHVNQNGLDCRKDNLRLATNAQNQQNVARQNNNTSGYKGVSRAKARSIRWRASIRHNYKKIYLGTFDTAVEAARAYDAKAKELFGEFALLNFPNEGSQP